MNFPSDDLSEEITKKSFCIIGCGHITQSTMYNLTKLNVPLMYLVDPDTVERKNVESTYYMRNTSGQSKIYTIANFLDYESLGNTQYIGIRADFKDLKNERFPLAHFYICGVDSAWGRLEIFDMLLSELKKNPGITKTYFIDLRSNFNFSNIYLIDLTNEDSIRYYRESLKDMLDAVTQRTCTRYNHILNIELTGVAVIRLIDYVLKGNELPLCIGTVNASLLKMSFFPELNLTFDEPIYNPNIETEISLNSE